MNAKPTPEEAYILRCLVDLHGGDPDTPDSGLGLEVILLSRMRGIPSQVMAQQIRGMSHAVRYAVSEERKRIAKLLADEGRRIGFGEEAMTNVIFELDPTALYDEEAI